MSEVVGWGAKWVYEAVMLDRVSWTSVADIIREKIISWPGSIGIIQDTL